MKIGSIVKFKDGLYADEVDTTYRVIENNGDRVFLEYICDVRFLPQSVALVRDLEVLEIPNA